MTFQERAVAGDPFFTLPGDGTWNACLGQQGDELNYRDGYMEAAFELADAVVERQLFAKRDTLVLPILYTARHAVELLLKHVINQLADHGVLKERHAANHDIQSHFDLLKCADLGDETFSNNFEALGPFVASLAKIDDDGQALRYHVGQDGSTSLEDYSLANLDVIRASLKALQEIVNTLRHRTEDFLAERKAKAFTQPCSRRDLMVITEAIPPRAGWNTPAFDTAKNAMRRRFKLSSRQFSDAVNVIKTNREMNAILGVETNLLSLTDDEAVAVIEQWRKLNPAPEPGQEPQIASGADITVEKLKKHGAIKNEVLKALLDLLSADDIADLEAIYYLGRDGWFPELYEDRVAQIKRRQAVERDLRTSWTISSRKRTFFAAFRWARGVPVASSLPSASPRHSKPKLVIGSPWSRSARMDSISANDSIQSPGTEFLDAETGGQESTREDLNPFSENSFVTD
jgi:hypothetical protein